jgi:hypothetical protein
MPIERYLPEWAKRLPGLSDIVRVSLLIFSKDQVDHPAADARAGRMVAETTIRLAVTARSPTNLPVLQWQ